MKKNIIAIVFVSFVIPAYAQADKDPLFSTTESLDIAFNLPIKSIKNSKADSVYFKEKMFYRNAASITDSIPIGLKRRGNFRLEQCYFPPLWMKIEKKDGKNTLFEGNRKLKLVMPCDSRPPSSEQILREYICYKLYEVVTSYSFKSRLVNLHCTEGNGTKKKEYELKGILVEDPDKTAKRCGGKTTKIERIPLGDLNDTFALRFDLFQLLISNTDWSKRSQHNTKLIFINSKYIPVPYDFDMSGVVDAPYAEVSRFNDEPLPVNTVKERYYRGYCASAETTEFVRKEFLAKEEQLLSVPDEMKGSLPDKQIKSLKIYLEEFFVILKDDHLFQREVLDRCRPTSEKL